ncbi:MFS transporter [Actinosynnema sp. NPDC050436]|uniref:MFS transporter n=1 Tax=Actinosynnema sp. NPDC050436 TaxID=3155659 RepID=UPI0033ECE9FE
MTRLPSEEDRALGPRVALAVVFGCYGIALGSWFARIPWVQSTRGLSAAELAFVLAGAAIGGVAAMPATARLVARWGSRVTTSSAVAVTAITTAAIPHAPSAATLFVVLLSFGAAGGALDVAMNVHAVTVQEHYGRPILSRLHGLWSIGALIGSSTSGAVAEAGVSAPVNLGAAGAVLLVVAVCTRRGLAGVPPRPRTPPGRVFAVPDRSLLVLGATAFCGLFAEAAMADWSAVYLASALRAPEAVAAWGYSAFILAMAVGRFAGDRVAARVGAPRLLRTTTLAGGIALATALLAPTLPVTIAAFAVLGLGVATVLPLTFSAAGRGGYDLGTSIAALSTAGYTGWLLAPPVIGLVAHTASLQAALATIGLATVLVACTASRV